MRGSLLSAVTGTGLLVSPGAAATRHVPSEYATIQAGLDASVAGDVVLVAPGVYAHSETREQIGGSQWTACVFMADGVTLRSEGGADVTVIDMQQAPGPQPQVVLTRYHTSGQTAIEGFTITGGPIGAQGAYTSFSNRITFRDCIFRELDAGESTGGGISANSDLLLERCEFVNCLASGGGAIAHFNARIEMYDCAIRECGDIAVLTRTDSGAPIASSHIEGCLFENCWGPGSAALSIQQHHGGSIVRNCHFIGNSGGTLGALGLSGNSPTNPKVVEGCLFWNNHSNGQGGGASMGGPGIVRGNTFFGNTAVATSGGSAVRFSNDGQYPKQLWNNLMVSNVSTGGAVYAANVTLESGCNVFWDNPPGNSFTPGSTDRTLDPLLCDPIAGDFHLSTGSPCLPEGSLGCELIGAFGHGCGTISIEQMGWGKIKAAYHGIEGSK